MKYIKEHKKRISIILILVIMVSIWGYMFFDVNARFPQANIVSINKGEIYLENGIEYCLVDSEIMNSQQELLTKISDANLRRQLEASKKVSKCVYVEFQITNKRNESVDCKKIAYSLMAECMPNGWANGGNVETKTTELKNGENTSIKAYFVINIPDNKEIFNQEFHIVLQVYPKKVYFVV